MSVTSETRKASNKPPPINTVDLTTSPLLTQDQTADKVTSPILRDFDRYPTANGRPMEKSINDSVSKIMNSAPISPPRESPNYTTNSSSSRKSSRASINSTASTYSDRRLTRKFQKGQLQISSPEGFKHVSGGPNGGLSSSQVIHNNAPVVAAASQQHKKSTGAAAAAAHTPSSPISYHHDNSTDSISTTTSNTSTSETQPPKVPNPPPSQGPPVKSYRESMALRGGVLSEPSTTSESRFSKALGSGGGSNNKNNTNNQTPPVPSPLTTHQLHQNAPHNISQSQATVPTPQAPPPVSSSSSSSRESKRISRFPWKRNSEKPPPVPALPSISQPILEYSTSELIHEGRNSQSVPLSEYFPNGPPGHENLMNPQNQPQQPRHAASSSRSSSSTMPNMNGNGSQVNSPVYSHSRQVSQRSAASSAAADNNSRWSKTETSPSTAATAPGSPVAYQQHIQQQTPLPHHQFPSSQSDLELSKWKQKCRESDDKRRALVNDYQQKLDAERTKAMELERKLEDLIRDKAASAATAVSMVSSTPKNPDLANKVKSLESQRKALKDALQNVRETKDLEIAEYKALVTKLRKQSTANGSREVRDDSSNSGTSSPNTSRSLSKSTELFGSAPTKLGIAPLLPTAGPYNMKSYT